MTTLIPAVHRRAVRINPLRDLLGPIVFGTVEPVTLECGHELHLNPTMLHKVGDLYRCRECEDEYEFGEAPR